MKKNETKRKTFELRLTKLELQHLRDMMSVLLPPDATKTISQSLAEVESRTFVETLLWKKISTACKAADIPLGEEAPDYVIAPTGTPPLAVFQIASEPAEQAVQEDSAGTLNFIQEN